jgi:hypothetical protein
MMEIGSTGVHAWDDTQKLMGEWQHCSKDRRVNAQNANCILRKVSAIVSADVTF